LVASEYRSNTKAIQTWRGKVRYTERVSDKSKKGRKDKLNEGWEDRETVTELEFAYDFAAKKYIFFATQSEQSRNKEGQARNKTGRIGWGGIRTAKGYYRVPEWRMDGNEGQVTRPSLLLQPLDSASPGDFSPDFDPLWYFRLNGDDVYERLMFFHKNAELKSMEDVAVSRERNLVTLTLGKPEKAINKYVFDLDQGGNPIEVSGSGRAVSATDARSFVKVGTIWVPKTATARNTNIKVGRLFERKMSWLENVVNEPIPEEVFLPEKIGLRTRDLVQDSRTGIQYRYEAAALPEELIVRKRNWVPYLVFGILAAVAGILLVAWRIRRRRPTEPRHAPLA
jgi:hypothetical protein